MTKAQLLEILDDWKPTAPIVITDGENEYPLEQHHLAIGEGGGILIDLTASAQGAAQLAGEEVEE